MNRTNKCLKRMIILLCWLFFYLLVSSLCFSFLFSICWDSPQWAIIGLIGAVVSSHWAGSAPLSTEVMCLPWHCPTAPEEQWLEAGITSGLSDPGHSCQDKQPWYWKSRGGGSVSCFLLWSLNLSPSCSRAEGKWPDTFIRLLMLPLWHPELVMIVEKVRYLKRKKV